MKYKIITINTSFLFILAILFGGFSGALAVTQVSTSTKLLPVYSVATNDKKIAITFDAAWEPTDTDKIIGILKKYNAKATIFCVGDWIKKNPEDVLKFYNSGHEIGNHSYSHKAFSKLTRDETKEEIILCNQAIEDLIGIKPTVIRAPSGDYDNKSIEIAESLNMKMIQWNKDSLDYTGISVDEIYERLTENHENGSILLFHNGVDNTAPALEKILSFYKNEGYSFVTVSELIYKDNYSINFKGQQYLNN